MLEKKLETTRVYIGVIVGNKEMYYTGMHGRRNLL